jgi:hypothetical protein
MIRTWVALIAGLAVLAGCGEAEEQKSKIQNEFFKQALTSQLDDNNQFKATIVNSPFQLDSFDAKLSILRLGDAHADRHGESRKIDIKSGDTTLNFGIAVNYIQGVSIVINRWRGETSIPIYNPTGIPSDGSAYAIVAYSETRRNIDGTMNEWYTMVTLGGTVTLSAVDVSSSGGVKGTIEFDVVLVDPAKPLPTSIEGLAVTEFSGSFNVLVEGGFDPFLFP